MSSDVSVRELIVRANRLLANGDSVAARQMAQQAYNLNKKDPDVLVLVSKVITDPARQRNVLQQALEIDPTHREARQRLDALNTPTLPAVPPPKPRAFPVLPLVAGMFGVAALLVLVGILVNRSHSDGSATEPTAAVALQSTVAAVPNLMASTPTNDRVFVSPTALPSATLAPSAIPATANTAGLDPLVLTATTIQQNIAATGTGLAQAAGNRTQIAALTQTATQQGALGATVVAQQTAMAALSALPGTLIVLDNNTHHITASNIQFVTVNGWLSPDGNHVAYTKITSIGLFLANQDGSGEQPVTGLPDYKNETAFAWSPDGHWLSVSLASGVYLVSVQDRVAHALLLSGTVAWSPDHQHVAVLGYVVNSTVTGQTSLYIIDLGHLDAPPLHITLPKPVTVNQSGAPVFELAGWFGDDQHILFTKSVRGSTEVEGSITLLVLDLKTQAQRALRMFPITEISLLDKLTIAPDGQHLAMLGYAHTVAFPDSKIYLLDANGHDLKVLPATMVQTDFAWSPDSKRLAISSTNGFGYDTNIDQWFQFDDLSLHQVLPGVKGLTGGLWSPDSRSLVICQFTQRDGLKVTAGKLLLIPTAAGSTPVTLVDQYVCPSMWVP